MAEQLLSARMAVMRDLVQELEQRVGSGEVPTEGLESFKAAIDDIRLRLWALLAGAYEPGNRKAAMQRFRLQRAVDVCRAVKKDLGPVSWNCTTPSWESCDSRLTSSPFRWKHCSGASDGGGRANVNILIVEDSPLVQEMYGLTFRECEHVLHLSANGREGLQLLERLVRCDVVLLDLHMPEMDGVEFIREVRWNPKLRSVPIIVVTAEPEESALVKAARVLNVAAVVHKPWDAGKLRDLVERTAKQRAEPG